MGVIIKDPPCSKICARDNRGKGVRHTGCRAFEIAGRYGDKNGFERVFPTSTACLSVWGSPRIVTSVFLTEKISKRMFSLGGEGGVGLGRVA